MTPEGAMTPAAAAAPGPGRARVAAVALLCSMSIGAAADAGQTPAAQATPAPTWQASISNLTRVESWRFFEPPPDGRRSRLRLPG